MGNQASQISQNPYKNLSVSQFRHKLRLQIQYLKYDADTCERHFKQNIEAVRVALQNNLKDKAKQHSKTALNYQDRKNQKLKLQLQYNELLDLIKETNHIDPGLHDLLADLLYTSQRSKNASFVNLNYSAEQIQLDKLDAYRKQSNPDNEPPKIPEFPRHPATHQESPAVNELISELEQEFLENVQSIPEPVNLTHTNEDL